MHIDPSPGVVQGRYLFLRALQHSVPEFFRSLHHGCVRLKHSTSEWSCKAGVTDGWLLQVVEDTVDYWRTKPEHGGSQLLDGWNWFYYRENNAPIRPFVVTIDPPTPIYDGLWTEDPGPSIEPARLARMAHANLKAGVETPAEFKRRAERQFKRQLSEYLKYMKPLSVRGDTSSMRVTHAQWTALVFWGRATTADISKQWPSIHRYQEPEAAVRTAVSNFAKAISLTLPKPQTKK
jgi:hypothetical protein